MKNETENRERNVGWIINNPFELPTSHWKLDERGRATDQAVSGRRASSELTAVPGSDYQISNSSMEPHHTVNKIRDLVSQWRNSGYSGLSQDSNELLFYWVRENQYERPFFCQIEVLETLMWLRESAHIKTHDATHRCEEIHDHFRRVNADLNFGIDRLAFKMATGTGKTKVMAMTIAYLTIVFDQSDYLVIAPNLTIRSHLGNLKSLVWDVVPVGLRRKLRHLQITVLNFQAFQSQNVSGFKNAPTRTEKKVLGVSTSEWVESPDQMLMRLLRDHASNASFVVINDEAHHCRFEAGTNQESSAETVQRMMWSNALKELQDVGRLDCVFDFSATPMYLNRSQHSQSVLFPWIATDYPLIEAIEAGLVKIPRVPRESDGSELVSARRIYEATVNKNLSEFSLTEPVNSLLDALVRHHQTHADYWRLHHCVEPVFIVVADTIRNAQSLYRWIAGYKDDSGRWIPGNIREFSNVRADGSGPNAIPKTLLVTSRVDNPEDAGSMGNDLMDDLIEVHAPDLVGQRGARMRFRNRLRDTFMSVGKQGQLGEKIQCVVSVSMLTEGWDTRTVTSIFGFRAFGSALLCEQVAGRALRRTEHILGSDGKLSECYADIFGVPFEFLPHSARPRPSEPVLQVEYMTERGQEFGMSFPNVLSYDFQYANLTMVSSAQPFLDEVEPFNLTSKLPDQVEIEGTIGRREAIEVKRRSTSSAQFRLAAICTVLYHEGELAAKNPPRFSNRRLFIAFLQITKKWWKHPNVQVDPECIDHNIRHPDEQSKAAARSLIHSMNLPNLKSSDQNQVIALMSEPHTLHTREFVAYRTAKTLIHKTKKSAINYAVCDSVPELEVAKILDQDSRIVRWVRNEHLSWSIPWYDTDHLRWRAYEPDFVAEVLEGNQGVLRLVIEYKGLEDKNALDKERYTRNYWIPAMNAANVRKNKDYWSYVYIKSDRNADLAHVRRQINIKISEEIDSWRNS